MRIKEVRAALIDITPRLKTRPRTPPSTQRVGTVSPMSRYPEFEK